MVFGWYSVGIRTEPPLPFLDRTSFSGEPPFRYVQSGPDRTSFSGSTVCRGRKKRGEIIQINYTINLISNFIILGACGKFRTVPGEKSAPGEEWRRFGLVQKCFGRKTNFFNTYSNFRPAIDIYRSRRIRCRPQNPKTEMLKTWKFWLRIPTMSVLLLFYIYVCSVHGSWCTWQILVIYLYCNTYNYVKLFE